MIQKQSCNKTVPMMHNANALHLEAQPPHCGYGKIILFGEHFVVHGAPALACALPLYTHATIKPTRLASAITLIDRRPLAKKRVPYKNSAYHAMAEAIFKNLGVTSTAYTITLQGTLPLATGGIGSSAAAAVAIAHASNKYFSLHKTPQELNNAAFVGEACIHATPSGIDNTAASFGGVFTYQNKQANHLHLNHELHIVIADSGRQTNIQHVIHDSHDLTPQTRPDLFDYYQTLFTQGLDALMHQKIVELGQLMTLNHHLLRSCNLSCPELDFMVQQSINVGALGAKLTGTGRGGIMIALAPDAATQNTIHNHLAQHGFWTSSQSITTPALPSNHTPLHP